MFCPSSTGSHSSDSNDTDQQPLDDSAHINGTLSSSKSSVWSSRSSEKGLQRGGGGVGGKMGGYLTESREMSRSYSSQSVSSSHSTIGPSGNQEHRCKYPGCNQVSGRCARHAIKQVCGMQFCCIYSLTDHFYVILERHALCL